MEKKPYQILRIEENSLDTYGDVFLVFANRPIPSMEAAGFTAFTHREDENTEVFIYPRDESMIDPLGSICVNGDPWYPNPNDYKDGGIRFNDNRKTAHYHYSVLTPKKSVSLINYIVWDLRYDYSADEINLKEEEREHWEFAVDEIRTPHGELFIDGFMEVEQNGLVGVQLETDGYLDFSELPGYAGAEDEVYVQTVAVMRQPNNVWLWLYLFDEDHNPVLTVCGTEEDVMENELVRFIKALRKNAAQ